MKNKPILENEVAKAIKTMCDILTRGNNAEIKRNSDGTVKVYEVTKKVR